jgi:hypothetical protein
MTTDLKPKGPEREKSPWFQVGQFLFLLPLAVAVFACPKHGAPPLLSGRLCRPIQPYQTIAGTKRVLDVAPSDAKLLTT